MFRNNIFRKLINAVSGGETEQSAPPSGSSELQEGDQSEVANTKEAESTEEDNPKVDNTEVLKRIAAQSHQEDKAQFNAGVKAYTNKEYDEAIDHYKKAIAINPSDGSFYNNIGNVYLRGKNDPETALQYYVQATTIQPSFNYGWYNLALCQKKLGDISGAKTTISEGLKVLNSEDGLYEILTQLHSQLE